MRINVTYIVTCGLIGLATFSGCASLADFKYEQTQRLRASSQFRECGKNCSKYPKDYKSGWKDGFYEVSTGGSHCPPAVAPARYWKPGQILKDCDNRRHAYYSGWQDGAARASQFPDTHFLRIHETCECPFPRCENDCVSDCGFATTAMPVDDMMVESNLPIVDGAAQERVNQTIEDIDASPMPPAPVRDDETDEGEDEDSDDENDDEASDESKSAADYNFLDDGGLVIDFTSERQPESPSDFVSGPVVTGIVGDLDFTFGDEDIYESGMIESDQD